MKKVLFMAALAAAALSSCSNEEIMEQGAQASQGSIEDGAVMFSAYQARTTRATRATSMTTDILQGYGFGVFAYEQGATPWATYSTSSSYPNFFYNQKVSYGDISSVDLKTEITKAVYDALSSTLQSEYTVNGSDPGKYDKTGSGSAITAAAFEALSNADKAAYKLTMSESDWTYAPIKYYSNNENAKHSFFAYAPYSKDVKAVFTVGKAPQVRFTSKDDYDLLWGCESGESYAPTDKGKQAVTGPAKITFQFKHALSKVSFDVAPFVDEVHSNSNGTHSAAGTLGTLAEGTKIILRSIKFVGNVASKGLLNLNDGSWTIEATEESAYEVATAVEFDATSGPLACSYKPAAADMMVIPTSGSDKVNIQVVYDVITVDPLNPKNNSIVTNTVTSEEGYSLTQSKSYKFYLDLGMSSVHFAATVADWTDATPENYVDLPVND